MNERSAERDDGAWRTLLAQMPPALAGVEFHFADLPDGECVSEMWRGGKKIAGGSGPPWSEESLFDRMARAYAAFDPVVAPTEDE